VAQKCFRLLVSSGDCFRAWINYFAKLDGIKLANLKFCRVRNQMQLSFLFPPLRDAQHQLFWQSGCNNFAGLARQTTARQFHGFQPHPE
jgi:hypothetical protein